MVGETGVGGGGVGGGGGGDGAGAAVGVGSVGDDVALGVIDPPVNGGVGVGAGVGAAAGVVAAGRGAEVGLGSASVEALPPHAATPSTARNKPRAGSTGVGRTDRRGMLEAPAGPPAAALRRPCGLRWRRRPRSLQAR
jgi:hypothetical protein